MDDTRGINSRVFDSSFFGGPAVEAVTSCFNAGGIMRPRFTDTTRRRMQLPAAPISQLHLRAIDDDHLRIHADHNVPIHVFIQLELQL